MWLQALILAAVSLPAAASPGAGDAVITEVMPAPTPGSWEWFELYNDTGSALDFSSCVLSSGHPNGDATDHFDLLDGLQIASGDYAVLAKSSTRTCVGYDSDDLAAVCSVEPDFNYSGAFWLSQDADETLCVYCGFSAAELTDLDSREPSCADLAVEGAGTLVDEVSYNYADVANDCALTDNKNCTMAQRGAPSASGNDDASSWCVSGDGAEYYTRDDETTPTEAYEARGTPGVANICPEAPPDHCASGQAFFTEVMTDPVSDVYRHEWVEIEGAGDSCSLDNCFLALVDSDGQVVDGAFEDGEITGGKFSTIDQDLRARAGDYLLMSHGVDPLSDGDVPIPVDYEYSNDLWLSADTAGVTLNLYCGGDGTGVASGSDPVVPTELFGELVDSMPLYFPFLADYCPDGGCSMNLPAESEGAADNDDPDTWCVPPLDGVYPDGDYSFVGTPDQAGSCQTYAWPQPGELVFSEVAVSGADMPDWFELKNLTDSPVELNWCILERYRLEDADTGGQVETSLKQQAFVGGATTTYPMAAGDWQVFSYGGCLTDSVSADTGVDTGAVVDESCAGGEYPYTTVDLTASNTEHLMLSCGGTLIDEISFNFDYQGVRKGHSLMLDPSVSDPATANDDWDNWCEAALTQECWRADDQQCNYGTPDAANECLTDLTELPSGPGCMCSSGGSRFSVLLAALAALGLGLVRRRRD